MSIRSPAQCYVPCQRPRGHEWRASNRTWGIFLALIRLWRSHCGGRSAISLMMATGIAGSVRFREDPCVICLCSRAFGARRGIKTPHRFKTGLTDEDYCAPGEFAVFALSVAPRTPLCCMRLLVPFKLQDYPAITHHHEDLVPLVDSGSSLRRRSSRQSIGRVAAGSER